MPATTIPETIVDATPRAQPLPERKNRQQKYDSSAWRQGKSSMQK